MSDINFRVYTNIDRPSPESVNRFKDIPVAFLGDRMNRIACMSYTMKPYGLPQMCGTAITVKAAVGDNLMFHKALDMAKPGDIVVVDARGDLSRALCGDNMILYAKLKGLAGIIVDGCIRDAKNVATMGFPVYACGVSPNGPFKNGPGEINVPISCAGQVVFPGDIIVGDSDGVVVIRKEEADVAYEDGMRQVEDERLTKIDINAGCLDREWIDEKLTAQGCVIYD